MKHLALFIEPTATQLNIFSAFTVPRLGSFILGWCRQEGDRPWTPNPPIFAVLIIVHWTKS